MNNDIYATKEDTEYLVKIEHPNKNQKIQSRLKIFNMTISLTGKVNWFQKLMYKLFFGIEIEKLESKDE